MSIKGSWRRPMRISPEEYGRRHDMAFGKRTELGLKIEEEGFVEDLKVEEEGGGRKRKDETR